MVLRVFYLVELFESKMRRIGALNTNGNVGTEIKKDGFEPSFWVVDDTFLGSYVMKIRTDCKLII